MTYLPPEAHAQMARQHGVISVHQLDEYGVTRRQVKTLEANDALRLVLRGVYRSPSVGLTEAGRCAAVSLARPAAVIAGPTAGRLWGFRKMPGDRRIHVIVPPAANPSTETWVRAFRTSTITADDSIQRADGIRLASRERAAVDLARFVRGDDLLSIIDQAMHDGRLGLDDMYAVATRWVPNRRPWLMQYLRQLSRVLSGGPSESHAEVRVGVALRQRGVRGLVRQHEVVCGSRTIRFDLAVPEIRWALEVDVFPTHRETIGWLADERRDEDAESLGWVVFRIDRNAYDNHFTTAIERARQSYLDVRRIRTDEPQSPRPPTRSSPGEVSGRGGV